MRKIRLLQIGHGNNSVIHRVSSALTRLQDVYEFMFFDDVIILAKGDASNGDCPMAHASVAALSLTARHARRHYVELGRNWL